MQNFLGSLLGTIFSGVNMFSESRSHSPYIPPEITAEKEDANGHPVLTVRSSHSEHVGAMFQGTTYPGAVYRKITRTGWHEYRVTIEPFDTEFEK